MAAYISEITYEGIDSSDWVEVAVDAGTDVSGYSIYIYNIDGSVEAGPLSLGAVQSTVAGKDVYLVDSGTPGFSGYGDEEAVALVDDLGNVVQFVSFSGNQVTGSQGPANGDTSTSIGNAGASQSLQSDNGGSSYYTQSSPNSGSIPCYAPGTLIETPDGPRAVEALALGDLVQTLDHGPLPVRWLQRREIDLRDAPREQRPVLISSGALGPGRTEAELIVSPQHRILVGGVGQLDGLGQGQAFAPAKALTGLPGIRHMMGRQSAVWVHFALAGHEVVTANGCLSESLLLGPVVLARLSARQRKELQRLFPTSAKDAPNGPPARDCLTVGEVRRVLEEWCPCKTSRADAA